MRGWSMKESIASVAIDVTYHIDTVSILDVYLTVVLD